MSIEKEFLAHESGVDYDEYTSDKNELSESFKNLFESLSLLFGIDIDLLVQETIEDLNREDIFISKINHIQYIEFRKKRKFKKKVK